jgi:hypothetical protein
MKKEKTTVFLKRILEWFDETSGAKMEGTDREDRTIECSLIRSFSELNQKDLNNHKLSNDFHRNLLMELNKIEPDPITIENKLKNIFEKPTLTYSLSFAGLVLLILMMYTSLPIGQPTKIDKFDLNLETAMVEDDELDELDVLTDLKKVQEDIDLLQKLERYYTVHGNTEKADRVHFKLETISR